MPQTKTYTVQAPDGKTITLEGPADAPETEVIAQAQRLYQAQGMPQGLGPTKPTALPPVTPPATYMDFQSPFARFLHPAAQAGQGMMDMLRHPVDAAQGMINAQLGQAAKVTQPGPTAANPNVPGFDVAGLIQRGGHALASTMPIIGPIAAQLAEEPAKSGDVAGVLGGATMMLAPEAVKVAKYPARAVEKAATQTAGVLTGAGSEAFKTALTKPESVVDAMRGKITEPDIVRGFKDALQDLKDKRGAEYRQKLSQLPAEMKLDLSDLKQEASSQLSKYGIKRTPEGLDFSRSTIHDAAEQAKVANLIKDVDSWGSKAGDTSALGVDTLKRRLADFYSPSGQARALVQTLKKATDSTLDRVPGYREMTKKYATASEFINKLESEFSLGPNANEGTVTRKLSYALKQNNNYRQMLVEALDNAATPDLKGQLAGSSLSKLSPRGLAAPGAGLALIGAVLNGTLNPVALTALLGTSPRLAGEVAVAIGRLKQMGKGRVFNSAAYKTGAGAGAGENR